MHYKSFFFKRVQKVQETQMQLRIMIRNDRGTEGCCEQADAGAKGRLKHPSVVIGCNK